MGEEEVLWCSSREKTLVCSLGVPTVIHGMTGVIKAWWSEVADSPLIGKRVVVPWQERQHKTIRKGRGIMSISKGRGNAKRMEGER